jgi:nitrate/TMAO reductase-like tetraheme cytochrome c subunit
MSNPMPNLTPPRRRRLMAWGLAALALAVAPVVLVKRADQDNRFCVSCHLHQAIYRNTLGDSLVTLATAHYRARHAGHPERCFTCHSGEGVVGWSAVTALSAWDAGRWVLGDRHEPTSMRLPLTNDACLKCHAEVTHGTLSDEETSKYHELLNHRAVKTPCVACHVTHARGTQARHFLDPAIVRRQCQVCHRNMGGDSGGDGGGEGS